MMRSQSRQARKEINGQCFIYSNMQIKSFAFSAPWREPTFVLTHELSRRAIFYSSYKFPDYPVTVSLDLRHANLSQLNGSIIKDHVIFVIKAKTLLLSADADFSAHHSLEPENPDYRIYHGYRLPDWYLARLDDL